MPKQPKQLDRDHNEAAYDKANEHLQELHTILEGIIAENNFVIELVVYSESHHCYDFEFAHSGDIVDITKTTPQRSNKASQQKEGDQP
jgi:hypothetical protein